MSARGRSVAMVFGISIIVATAIFILDAPVGGQPIPGPKQNIGFKHVAFKAIVYPNPNTVAPPASLQQIMFAGGPAPEFIDTENGYNPITGAYRVQVNGTYRVTVQLTWNNDSGIDWCKSNLLVHKNGMGSSDTLGNAAFAVKTGGELPELSQQVSGLMYLVKGDELTFHVIQRSSPPTTRTASRSGALTFVGLNRVHEAR
ncbi:MAG: hypothetical protein RL885_01425 [Planctomycetota bacterium]